MEKQQLYRFNGHLPPCVGRTYDRHLMGYVSAATLQQALEKVLAAHPLAKLQCINHVGALLDEGV